MGWFRSHTAKVSTSSSKLPRRRLSTLFRIELLEDRCLPSVFIPTTFLDGAAGSGSLRDAVLQANADTGSAIDTIQLQAGTYQLTIINTNGQENGGLQGDLDITNNNHPLIIEGVGASGSQTTTIDAIQLQDRVFQIVNPRTQVTFKDLIISGGLAQDNGSPSVQPGKTPAFGGGILNNGSTVTLNGVLIENCVAQGGNGAAGARGAKGQPGHHGFPGQPASGGGLYSIGGTVSIINSVFTKDQAIGGNGGTGGAGGASAATGGHGGLGGSAQGGGLYADAGSVHLLGSALTFNQALAGHGGKGGVGGPGTHLVGSARVGGTGGIGGAGGVAEGGGLFSTKQTLTVTDSALADNQATGGAGGIGGDGGSPAVFFSVSGGPGGAGGAGGAAQGGGLFAGGGMVTLRNSTISTNLLSGGAGGTGGSGGGASFGGNGGVGGVGGASQGSGLFTAGATLDLIASTIDNNHGQGGAGGNGGFGQGGFTTGFSGTGGNGGAGGSAQGGGLFALSGQLTLTNSTIAVNVVQGGTGGTGGTEGFATGFGNGGSGGHGGASQGGGLYFAKGTLHLTNDTVGQNQSLDSLGGLAAINGSPGQGSKGQGGGVANAAATVNALNTIFGEDKASVAPDFSGNFATANFNLVEDGTGSNLPPGNPDPNGNRVGTTAQPIDPLLLALANNGGVTKTMALQSASPAIDNGTPTGAPATDQRGVTRGNPPDIGAYESSSAAGANLVTIANPIIQPVSSAGFDTHEASQSDADSLFASYPDRWQGIFVGRSSA